MSVQVARRQFSVGDYERMVETGILGEHDRVELIEGEILEMSPIGERHAACVRKINRTLVRLAGDRSLVSVQSPIAIPEWSEPEPDVAEVWVIDLRKHQVLAFTTPRLGAYRTRRVLGAGETIEAKRPSGLVVSTDDLLL